MSEVCGVDFYDEDYYERGLETGKSSYQNYRWIPESTIPLAMTIVDFLNIKRGESILDFGCAKGFLVKAFRLLYREAWGVDISPYAIRHVDTETKTYCYKKEGNVLTGSGVHFFPQHFDICIAKDVLEHVQDIGHALKWIPARKLFVVVPLGRNGKFFAPANGMDKSHCNCWDLDTWKEVIENYSWRCVDRRLHMAGIKDSYYDKYPKAHGFLTFNKIPQDRRC